MANRGSCEMVFAKGVTSNLRACALASRFSPARVESTRVRNNRLIKAPFRINGPERCASRCNSGIGRCCNRVIVTRSVGAANSTACEKAVFTGAYSSAAYGKRCASFRIGLKGDRGTMVPLTRAPTRAPTKRITRATTRRVVTPTRRITTPSSRGGDNRV